MMNRSPCLEATRRSCDDKSHSRIVNGALRTGFPWAGCPAPHKLRGPVIRGVSKFTIERLASSLPCGSDGPSLMSKERHSNSREARKSNLPGA